MSDESWIKSVGVEKKKGRLSIMIFKIPTKFASHFPKRLLDLIVALSCTLLIIFQFQNCSQVEFSAIDAPSTTGELASDSRLSINNGAMFSSSSAVHVQIVSPSAVEMYLTNDPACASGGDWEPMASERLWTLAQTNAQATVYAKFKGKSGSEYACINTSIIHDDIGPVTEIISGPGAYSRNTLLETLTLVGRDERSGLERFECRLGSGSFQSCNTFVELGNLTEGPQAFQARAVDKAGNVGPAVEHFWVIDVTLPTLSFIETPAAFSTTSFARFMLDAKDDDKGSGLERVVCQWDSGPLNQGCALTESMSGLTDGAHTFTAWAVDRAGNESPKMTWSWTIDTTPSGAFNVIGVTGGADVTKDSILGTTLTPAVWWTASNDAVNYTVSILSDDGTTTVCAGKSTTQTNYAFLPRDCTLVDGSHYRVKVVAVDAAGLNRAADLFRFTVDVTPPQINITGPIVSDDQKSAKFDFTITDTNTDVADAMCKRTYKGVDQIFACKDLTTYTFTNLQDGDHVFSIAAIDMAGNSSMSATITWKVRLVVCDLFSLVEGQCRKGLRANLYYLTGRQLTSPYTAVDDYIKYGKLANAIIYMGQLLVPTRSFSSGFASSDNTFIVDDNNQKLIEYFALDLETVVKLSPSDVPGHYQFGILSDDGSIIEIKDTPTSAYRAYVNNDGFHPTKFKCDTVGTNLTTTTRLPMRIKYFQGPRTEIALTLMWRKLDSAAASKADSACDRWGDNLFFGPNRSQPDLVNYEYGQLLRRGWKPLAPENFILPEAQ